VTGPGRLRWRLHEAGGGSAARLRAPAAAEGLVQVLSGSCSARAGGGAEVTLDTEYVMWHRGAGAIDVVADGDCTLLHAWAPARARVSGARRLGWSDAPPERLNDSLTGRSIGGEDVSAWRFDVRAGYDVRDLLHAEEQISCAVAGRFRMLVGGAEIPMDRAVVTHVPAWVQHGGVFDGGPVELLEVFCPGRLSDATRAVEP